MYYAKESSAENAEGTWNQTKVRVAGMDLGHNIGSSLWYRQFATLVALLVSSLGLGIWSTSATPSPPLNNSPIPDTVAVVEAADIDTAAILIAEISTIESATLLTTRNLPVTTTDSSIVADEIPAPGPFIQTLSVRRGETLMTVLTKGGVNRTDANRAIHALSKNFNMRRLQVGQEIEVAFTDPDKTMLQELRLKPRVDQLVTASRLDDDSFVSRLDVIELEQNLVRAGGQINDSLYMAMSRAGVAPEVIADLIFIFSFDVDFQREIRRGDKFELFYEQYLDDTGATVKNGVIQFASLTLRGKAIDLYRYTPVDDKRADYFNEKGHSVRKALLRTPVDGARLTSRFGKRRHPILGYNKMHRGIDFGAKRGTPIRAAGDGIVERASRHGGYGKYVRIRHNGTYKTAYAHMSGYGRGIKKGVRVRQGDIVGYVGSTGQSTGPHLHYEVHKGGKQVNPLGLKLPTGRKLVDAELVAFKEVIEDRKIRIAATPIATTVAASGE